MVFQSYALYPHMTVRDNIAFPLRTAKRSDVEVHAKIAEAAQILKLEDLLDRKPSQLSGGQRQRVAIGRAIVKQPKLFLFDEPLSNLDAELRVHMRIEIAKLHRDLGTTVIYVTHDQVEAMTLASKIVVLREGKVEQVGSPLQLYDDPANVFVAGFIGSPQMNLIKARFEGDSLVLAASTGQTLPLPALATRLSKGQELMVGLRPQVIGKAGAACLDLVIEFVEHLGAETLVHGRLQGSAGLITAAVEDGRTLSPGQQFRAQFDPTKLLLFGAGGERLR
jgi:lactose/L-arabinose transport system ATP-binding protein